MARIIRTSNRENGLLFKDRFFLWLFSVLSAGILIGSISVGVMSKNPISDAFTIWNENFLIESSQSIFGGFITSLASCFLFFLVSYLLGVCVVGFPFLFLISFVFGVGKGAYFAFLILNSGGMVLLKRMLLLLPQNIALIFMLLLALEFSAKMSVKTFYWFTANNSSIDEIGFRKFNQRYVLISVLLVFYCMFDAVLKSLI